MLKKILFVISLLFVLVATPALAHQSNNSNESESSCDETAEWNNHGEFVSCVAKTHPGGAAVSAAARSDVGKKDDDRDDDGDEDEDEDDDGGIGAGPSPSASVSPSPSASPGASPEVSPSPEASASPSPEISPSPSPTVAVETSTIDDIIAKLQELIDKLTSLL